MSQYIPFNYQCLFRDLDSGSASKIKVKGPSLPPSKLFKNNNPTTPKHSCAPSTIHLTTKQQALVFKGICSNSNDYRD